MVSIAEPRYEYRVYEEMSAGLGATIYGEKEYDTVYYDKELGLISPLGFQGTLWSLNIRMVLLPSFVRRASIILGQFMQLFGMSRPTSSESTWKKMD